MMAELDPGRQRLAREYARRQRWLSLVEMGLAGLLLVALAVSGASVGLARGLPSPLPVKVALYSLIVLGGYGLLQMPLGLYSDYILPRRFGLSTQTWRGWLVDAAKGGLLSLALGILLLVGIYMLLSRFPDTWWLGASLFVLLLSVVLTHLAPVLIIPLFFRQEPLDDPGLTQRLTDLARRAHTQVRGVFTINLGSKGTTANAALAGLGTTRRILLSDTMLWCYTPEELEAVLAHELGHHVGGHLWKTLAFQFGVVFGEFYLVHVVLRWATAHWGYEGVADVAAFPVLVLVLGVTMLLARPLTLIYLRRQEASADAFALGITGAPEPFLSMLTKLTDQNLGEAHPPAWVEYLFYDHPPYYRRAGRAQQWGV